MNTTIMTREQQFRGDLLKLIDLYEGLYFNQRESECLEYAEMLRELLSKVLISSRFKVSITGNELEINL